MSRRRVNDRWSVTCNKCTPTPYLVQQYERLMYGVAANDFIVDMGCGNGRNTKYLKAQGFIHTMAFDMAGYYGSPLTLGRDKFPVRDRSIKVILANYVLMFLNKKERAQVFREILRLAAPGCRLMVELYPAKDSCFQLSGGLEIMKTDMIIRLELKGWKVLHNVKHKFIMENANG